LIIPAILSGKDLIVKDETGSGKTLGILAGILSKKNALSGTTGGVEILVIVPTYILVVQVAEWAMRLTAEYPDSETLVNIAINMGDLESLQNQ
jgi:superfamily II DNA/RNA helicase